MERGTSAHIVVATVAAAVIAAGAATWFSIRGRQPATASSAAANSAAGVADSPAASVGSTAEPQPPGAKPRSLEDVARPHLTALWMTQPANPLIVSLTVGNREEEQKITPGGGEVELILETGDRVALRVPPGALLRNTEFRLQSVTGVTGWLHAPASVLSIRVIAEPGALVRAATLTIERRQRRDRAPLGNVAGFAVNPDSRELHLHPSTRGSRDENAEAIEIPIVRFGIYGIVEAAPADVQAMHARIPTDLLSRLEADVAVALLESAEVESTSLRSDVVLASLQSGAGSFPPFVPAWMAPIIANLRQYHEQVLLHYFKVIQPSCHYEAVPFFQMLREKATEWESLVEQLVRSTDQTSEGTTVPAEVAEYWRALREEFEQKMQGLRDRLQDHMKRVFAALDACCPRAPELWMPESMANLVREADMWHGGEAALGPDRWKKVDNCKCAANVLRGIEGWRGTITHTETFKPPPKVDARGNRTETNSFEQTYAATLVLSEERRDGEHVAWVRAHGTRKTRNDFVQATTARDCHAYVLKTHHSVSLTGEYYDQEVLDLNVQTDGNYTIRYPTPLVKGLESVEERREFTGSCYDWLRERNNWDKSSTRYSGVSGSEIGHLGGKVNEADRTRLKETIKRSVPLELNGIAGTLNATVTWDLTRCVTTK